MRSEIFRAVATPGEQRGSILVAGKQRCFRDADSGYGEPGRIKFPQEPVKVRCTRGSGCTGLTGPRATGWAFWRTWKAEWRSDSNIVVIASNLRFRLLLSCYCRAELREILCTPMGVG